MRGPLKNGLPASFGYFFSGTQPRGPAQSEHSASGVAERTEHHVRVVLNCLHDINVVGRPFPGDDLRQNRGRGTSGGRCTRFFAGPIDHERQQGNCRPARRPSSTRRRSSVIVRVGEGVARVSARASRRAFLHLLQRVVRIFRAEADERDAPSLVLGVEFAPWQCGIMARHGPHHVQLQNSTTYVLPATNALTSSPWSHLLARSDGAGSPILSAGSFLIGPFGFGSSAAAGETNATRTARTRYLRMAGGPRRFASRLPTATRGSVRSAMRPKVRHQRGGRVEQLGGKRAIPSNAVVARTLTSTTRLASTAASTYGSTPKPDVGACPPFRHGVPRGRLPSGVRVERRSVPATGGTIRTGASVPTENAARHTTSSTGMVVTFPAGDRRPVTFPRAAERASVLGLIAFGFGFESNPRSDCGVRRLESDGVGPAVAEVDEEDRQAE